MLQRVSKKYSRKVRLIPIIINKVFFAGNKNLMYNIFCKYSNICKSTARKSQIIIPGDPFRPVNPIETAEAGFLPIFFPILLHYISTRYLKNEVVKLLTLYSGIICWGQNLPISILVPQPSSKGLQQFPRQRFCKERHR